MRGEFMPEKTRRNGAGNGGVCLARNGARMVVGDLVVRFIAQDLGAGSLVEAAIDDLKIITVGCGGVSGDINGDGIVNGVDLAALLSQWGGPGSADSNGDQIVSGPDLAILLSNWG